MDIGIPPWLSGSLLEPDKCCWLIHRLLALCADICATDYQHDARSVQIPRSFGDECDRVLACRRQSPLSFLVQYSGWDSGWYCDRLRSHREFCAYQYSNWNFCLLCTGVVQSKKFGVERWSDPRLNTGLIFLVGGAVTGGATGKALDFYCWRIEQRLIRIEKERVDQETQERERLKREKFEKAKLGQEAIEAEMAERKRIQREAAQEEERLWYEQHGKDYADYEYDEEEE